MNGTLYIYIYIFKGQNCFSTGAVSFFEIFKQMKLTHCILKIVSLVNLALRVVDFSFYLVQTVTRVISIQNIKGGAHVFEV